MSLSEFCDRQHERERSNTTKLLLLSLVGSVGLHLLLSGTTNWGGGGRSVGETPIELLVMEPPPDDAPTETPIETPDRLPTQLDTATHDPSTAASAPASAPAASAPANLFSPATIEAIPDTGVDSEIAGSDIDDKDKKDRDKDGRIGDDTGTDDGVLEGTGDSDAEGSDDTGNDTGDGSGDSDGTGDGVEEAEGADGGTNDAGDGNGQGQGSRTVACDHCILPEYPDSALEAGVEGTPRVQVDIAPDGSVRGVTLVNTSGNPDIDRAAVEAARNSSFQPVDGGAIMPIDYDLSIAGSERNREALERGGRQSAEIPSYSYSGAASSSADSSYGASGYGASGATVPGSYAGSDYGGYSAIDPALDPGYSGAAYPADNSAGDASIDSTGAGYTAPADVPTDGYSGAAVYGHSSDAAGYEADRYTTDGYSSGYGTDGYGYTTGGYGGSYEAGSDTTGGYGYGGGYEAESYEDGVSYESGGYEEEAAAAE